jgi:hypothetical protein
MAQDQSADEVRLQHERVLGPEFGTQFNLLHNEFQWLTMVWGQFVQLYSTNTKRIELMNKGSGLFFRTVQDAMADFVILKIARFSEPTQTIGKDNLTIRRFPIFVQDSAKQLQLQELVTKAVDAAQFARDWRNRRIAHKDLALATGQSVQQLSPATKSNIEGGINSIREVFLWIHMEYFDSQFLYESERYPGDALSLLYHLRDGLEAREKYFEDLRTSSEPPNYWAPERAL